MTLQRRKLFNGEWIVYIVDQNLNRICAAIFSTEPTRIEISEWTASYGFFDL